MAKLLPQDSIIQRYIDYYWVIEPGSPLIEYPVLYDFPSLSPELIIDLEGVLTYTYKGKSHSISESILFTSLNERLTLNPSKVERAIVAKFRPLGLAAFTPFTEIPAKQLVSNVAIPLCNIMSPRLTGLKRHLGYPSDANLVDQLDSWLKQFFRHHHKGLMLDLKEEITISTSVRELANLASTSYSTLERHFKYETGLSPKRFLILNRFRRVIEDIATNTKQDWFAIVENYGYHDQNHFIKEIKRYTGFTPTELHRHPCLSLYR